VTWQYGQILFRLSWAPHQRHPTIRTTEYIVLDPTPCGGWIQEHDVYTGERPDRSKGNLRPLLNPKRTWRSSDANFVHSTLEQARTSLEARTKRHMKLLRADVDTVRRRLYELGVDTGSLRPSPFHHLRAFEP
jgi:hypothetical protein